MWVYNLYSPILYQFPVYEILGSKKDQYWQMGQHIIASLGFSRSINRNGTRWEIKRDLVGP